MKYFTYLLPPPKLDLLMWGTGGYSSTTQVDLTLDSHNYQCVNSNLIRLADPEFFHHVIQG